MNGQEEALINHFIQQHANIEKEFKRLLPLVASQRAYSEAVNQNQQIVREIEKMHTILVELEKLSRSGSF